MIDVYKRQGMYLALRSLPWAIPGLAALLLKVYRMMLVFLIGTGFYHASGIAALLLACLLYTSWPR